LLVVATLPVVAALLSGAGADRAAWVERPRWQPVEHALQLRYHGGAPRWTQGTLTGPHRVYVDLDARCRVVGVLTEDVARHPALVGWAMAPREGTHTRVTMVFRAPTAVSVRVDPAQRVVWLVPQVAAPAASPVPSSPVPSPPRVAQLRLRPSSFGPAPELPAPRFSPTPSPLPSPPPTPDLQAILAGLEALDRPLPLPSEPGSGVLPVPTASTEASPAPQPLPAPPTAPFPTPVVLPAGPKAAPFDLHLASAGMLGTYELGLSADNMAARADSASVVGGRLNGRWALGPPAAAAADGWMPWWSLQLDAWASSLTYLDPRIANGLHARQAWRAHAAVLRGVKLSPLELQGGLGFMARHQLDWQAILPVSGVALSATSRTTLAPELALFARVPVVAGLELYGEGTLAPVAWVLDGGTTEPAPTSGTRWEAGVGWTLGGLRVAAGYRRWGLGGVGYTEVLSGPVVTVGGWLAPGNPRDPGPEEVSAPEAPRVD
jgi:hypothetical protein